MKMFKNLTILGLISFTLIGCPLPDQDFSEIDYTIFNQTDKNLKVLGFIKDAPEYPLDPINIEPQSFYKVTRITGLDSDITKSFYSARGVDSVRVIFNNEKVKVYTRESVRNTPDASILDGDSDHNHFITEEDYNSAIDCNGDCE